MNTNIRDLGWEKEFVLSHKLACVINYIQEKYILLLLILLENLKNEIHFRS